MSDVPIRCPREAGYALLASGPETAPAGSRLALENKALKAVFEHTGGQPLLVQDLLRRLREPTFLRGTRIADPVEGAAEQQRRSPPEKTQLWQRGLHDLLVRDPELAHDFGSYVAGATLGETRFPPRRRELSLFIAGWLKLDHVGRWGIASKFHASLARSVLETLRRER